VPGAINVPFGRQLSTWVASLLPYGRPVFLLAEADAEASVARAARELALVGVDDVGGWLDAGALDVWAARHGRLEQTRQTTPREVAEQARRGQVAVVDVRGRAEWDGGHLPGVPNVPLPVLAQRIAEVRALADGRPIVVHCQGGTRSAVAASVLQAHGVTDVANMSGGYAAWRDAGLPVEAPDVASPDAGSPDVEPADVAPAGARPA
jgi:hydroxyacylglutathione hydrolase